MIALDTHVVVWWTLAPSHLSRRAAVTLRAADSIGVPAIVFWEVAMLVRAGRIVLASTEAWVQELLSIPRVVELPCDARTALRAGNLDMHGDPGDRLVVAAALEADVPLVTKDRRIRDLGWVPCVW